MKKTFVVLLSVVMLLGMIPVYSLGAAIVDSGDCGDNLTYTLDDEGTLTIEGYGPMWDFETEDHPYRPWDYYSPAVYDNYGEISSPEYHSVRKINRISLPEGLTTIGNWAFVGFWGTEIDIPSNVTTIGEGAFAYSALETIEIPNSVTEIGNGAFQVCGTLKTVVLPDHLSRIGDYVFSFTSIEEIQLPESVKTIGNHAFKGCLWLNHIDLPSQLQSLGEYAFALTGLKRIVIPSTCSFIGAKCFWWMGQGRLFEEIVILNDELVLEDLGIEYGSPTITKEMINQYEIITDYLQILQLAPQNLINFEYHQQNLNTLNSIQIFNWRARTDCKTMDECVSALPGLKATAIDNINAILGTSFVNPEEIISGGGSYTDSFHTALNAYFGCDFVLEAGKTFPWVTIYGHGGATSEAYADDIGATFVCLHEDNDENGYCDFCGKNLNGTDEPVVPGNEQTGEKCKYCDKVHGDDFAGRLTKFFHSILYFFAHLFGKK